MKKSEIERLFDIRIKKITDTIPEEIIKRYGIIMGGAWLSIRGKTFATDITYRYKFQVINHTIYTEIKNKKISVWLYLEHDEISVYTVGI